MNFQTVIPDLKVTGNSFAFHKFKSLTQGDEENVTRYTLLFTYSKVTVSNSWPVSFGKDSF